MNNWIELYRAFIPNGKIINANGEAHYKIRQGKFEWLGKQYNRIKSGEAFFNETTEEFKLPDANEVSLFIGDSEIELKCEIIKFGNKTFDPPNYADTFKAPIDKLVGDGFLKDDSLKIIRSYTYVGIGTDTWNRATRYENDGLPNELTNEWWQNYLEPGESFRQCPTLIRILVRKAE